MTRFEPFRALRYTASDVETIVAPPYDVISPQRRSLLVAQHPHNVVRIDLPDEADGPGRYEAANELLASWIENGIIAQDDTPAFYTYRMDLDLPSGPLRTIGFLGALELSRPGEGSILPHEYTTPKAKSDRLDLIRATKTNLSAIWGLSPAPGLTALTADAEILASWTGSDGTRHQLGRITDPDRLAQISAAVDSAPVVIADGHHRYETSLAYRDELRATSADGTAGQAESVLMFIVELVESELTVLPIHRLVEEIPDGVDLIAALEPFFELTEVELDPSTASATMAAEGSLMIVLPGQAWLAKPRAEALVGIRDLDSSRLDAALEAAGPHKLRYQHGVDNIVAAVQNGEAPAGVLLRPVRVAQIAEIAHGGDRMPPKSTFFNPKPSTGAVFRSVGG